MKRTSWPIHKDDPFAPIRVVIVGTHSSSHRKEDKKEKRMCFSGKQEARVSVYGMEKNEKKTREEILYLLISRRPAGWNGRCVRNIRSVVWRKKRKKETKPVMWRAESEGKNSKCEFHCAMGMQTENVDGEFRGNSSARLHSRKCIVDNSFKHMLRLTQIYI